MSWTNIKVGELPRPAVDGKFSYNKWNRLDKGKHPILSATSKKYREQKARLLLRKIETGALTGPGREGVERDYARELARLRKGAK